MKKSIIKVLLLLGLVLSGCASPISIKSSNLMSGYKESKVDLIDISSQGDKFLSRKNEILDFSLKLFLESFEAENILLSPLSIVYALAMTGNGAKNQTLLEIEAVLNSDIQGLNDYLKAYSEYLPTSQKYQVSLANSIWFKDDPKLVIENSFLQINKDYYDASIYKSAFDNTTKVDINNWVKAKTNNLITELLKQAPSPQTIMYLINALSFEAEWEEIYRVDQVIQGDFFLETGGSQSVEFMTSSESIYLENDLATGVIKPYKDSKYALVAFLPKDNLSIQKLLLSLDYQMVLDLFENKQEAEVLFQLPKMSIEYSTLLNEPLQNLGISDAFEASQADFSRLGKFEGENIFISQIVHKTKLVVDEKGSKAGAVTAVVMDTTSVTIDRKEVILNRPFVYMIIDLQQELPLFMGVLMSLN